MPLRGFVGSITPDRNKRSTQGRLNGMSPCNDDLISGKMSTSPSIAWSTECRSTWTKLCGKKKSDLAIMSWLNLPGLKKVDATFVWLPFSVAGTQDYISPCFNSGPQGTGHSTAQLSSATGETTVALKSTASKMAPTLDWSQQIPLQTGEVVGFGGWRFPFHLPDHYRKHMIHFENWDNMSQPPCSVLVN